MHVSETVSYSTISSNTVNTPDHMYALMHHPNHSCRGIRIEFFVLKTAPTTSQRAIRASHSMLGEFSCTCLLSAVLQWSQGWWQHPGGNIYKFSRSCLTGLTHFPTAGLLDSVEVVAKSWLPLGRECVADIGRMKTH